MGTGGLAQCDSETEYDTYIPEDDAAQVTALDVDDMVCGRLS